MGKHQGCGVWGSPDAWGREGEGSGHGLGEGAGHRQRGATSAVSSAQHGGCQVEVGV